MKPFAILLSLGIATTSWAQHEGHQPGPQIPPEEQAAPPGHEGHAMGEVPQEGMEGSEPHASHEMTHDGHAPPPAAFSGPLHAADALFDTSEMAAAREQLRVEEGGAINYLVLADRVETGFGDGDETWAWDLQGWYGGDLRRLWLKTEGEGETGGSLESAEVQALFSRAVTPFFDIQFGVRHDLRPDPERTYLVAGIQGLLPYRFELDAAVFLSDEGDLSGRLEGEYDLRVTQRVILQPRLELDLAAQDVPELGSGSGITSIEAGIRLRYEWRREFAPYIGLGWERKLGDTADFARAAGGDDSSLSAVAGVRAWF